MTRRFILASVSLILALVLSGCGGDEETSPKDTTAPAAIGDLSVTEVTMSSATLTWTAPGDDGTTGQAATYDVRYSKGEAATFDWNGATQASGEPDPHAAGTNETFTVNGLTAGLVYSFAVKTADEVPNWSPLSNIVSARTTSACQVDPTTLDFGTILTGTTVDRGFTIKNVGTGTLNGSVQENSSQYNIVAGAGQYSLEPGDSLTVTVQFAPTSAGTQVCMITTGNIQCGQVSCTGIATAGEPVCRIEPARLRFGEVQIGTTSDQQLTITNTGTGMLNGVVSEDSTEYEIASGGGSFSLGAGQSRTVTIRFAPIKEGLHTCIVQTGMACRDTCSGLAVDMVEVPAAPFTMGSSGDTFPENEKPQHSPSISLFHIDRYEVTNARYAEALNWARAHGQVQVNAQHVVTDASGTHGLLYMDYVDMEYPGNECHIRYFMLNFSVDRGFEDYPVVGLSWYGAAAYAVWRSGMAGREAAYDANFNVDWAASGYRLPTEAEWEKTARGASDARTYPWGEEEIDCTRCNYGPEPFCEGTTVPVHSGYLSGASPYGALHMAGNVGEWCNDWYDASYYSSSPATDPTGPSGGDAKVVRQGSWHDGADVQRCAFRWHAAPDSCGGSRIGFRTARAE